MHVFAHIHVQRYRYIDILAHIDIYMYIGRKRLVFSLDLGGLTHALSSRKKNNRYVRHPQKNMNRERTLQTCGGEDRDVTNPPNPPQPPPALKRTPVHQAPTKEHKPRTDATNIWRRRPRRTNPAQPPPTPQTPALKRTQIRQAPTKERKPITDATNMRRRRPRRC